MTGDVDTLALIQAIESLKDQKSKLLEDKVEFLNNRISLVAQRVDTALAELDRRLRVIETLLTQAVQAKQRLSTPSGPPQASSTPVPTPQKED